MGKTSDYLQKKQFGNSNVIGLSPIINVSGTMTSLGSSIVIPEAREEMNEILPKFINIHKLQGHISDIVATACDSEAGFITASAAAGISISVAGTMTHDSLLRIEKLPDTEGLKNEVIIQMGHVVIYGAPIDQAVNLTGAKTIIIGTATSTEPYHLEESITPQTACALYVISHHTVQYGQLPLTKFCEICHAKGVPVIVDAASEYDLKGFIKNGADIVIYSGHKFLGGPTSGIVAGKKELVRYAYLQNRGIGRGMKAGKESIIGAATALLRWGERNHTEARNTEMNYLKLWEKTLENFEGVVCTISPDPTNNPLDRLMVAVDPQLAGISAWQLPTLLAAQSPSIIVRDHEVEHGYFFLDPCNMHDMEEAKLVADGLFSVLSEYKGKVFDSEFLSLEEIRRIKLDELMSWPDI